MEFRRGLVRSSGPSGKPWRDTSIRGNARRGLGIINNELYVGVRVWNHKHKVKDPTTGKDVTRLNPESEWIRKEVPDLRIITDDLWEAAKRQQDVLLSGTRASRKRRWRGASTGGGVRPIFCRACSNAASAAAPMPSSSATVMAAWAIIAAVPAPTAGRSGVKSWNAGRLPVSQPGWCRPPRTKPPFRPIRPISNPRTPSGRCNYG